MRVRPRGVMGVSYCTYTMGDGSLLESLRPTPNLLGTFESWL